MSIKLKLHTGDEFEFIARMVKGRDGLRRGDFRYLFKDKDGKPVIFFVNKAGLPKGDHHLERLDWGLAKLTDHHYRYAQRHYYFHDLDFQSFAKSLEKLRENSIVPTDRQGVWVARHRNPKWWWADFNGEKY